MRPALPGDASPGTRPRRAGHSALGKMHKGPKQTDFLIRVDCRRSRSFGPLFELLRDMHMGRRFFVSL